MANSELKQKQQQEHFLVRAWYQQSFWLYLLLPLSCLYGLLIGLRHKFFQWGWLPSAASAVPLIVVGNIAVGGTGKTPLVVALVQALQQAGFKPGIVSRGYGSQAPSYPYWVQADDSPSNCGDEPLLMALRTQVPVVIDANRRAAVKHLLAHSDCDVIIADDGLQHYALQRDIEIVVVDGKRGFGNRLLLPAGPLRETVSRIARADYVVVNGGGLTQVLPDRKTPLAEQTMQLRGQALIGLHSVDDTSNTIEVAAWPYSKQVHAVAGIGNPQRFYTSLRQAGFNPVEHSFADHHDFTAEDLQFDDQLPVIMTEKDAVKVRFIEGLSDELQRRCWYLPVEAVIDEAFYTAIIAQLHSKILPAKKQSI